MEAQLVGGKYGNMDMKWMFSSVNIVWKTATSTPGLLIEHKTSLKVGIYMYSLDVGVLLEVNQ